MNFSTFSPRNLRDRSRFFAARNEGAHGGRKGSICAAIVLAGSLLFGVGAAPVFAQSTSWVVNIDNSKFSPLPAGGQADYQVKISNSDNFLTPETKVVFTIPADTIFTGVTPLTNCTPQPEVPQSATPYSVTCDLPSILPGKDLDVVLGVRHMEAGTTQVTALVTGGTGFTRKTTVHEGADLAIELTAAPSPVQAGENVTLSATVTNNGPHGSQNGRVVLTLPTGLSETGVVMPSNCAIAGNLITCELGDLPAGETLSFDFTAQVTAADASTATAAASVTAGTPRDPDNRNNSAVAEIDILEGTDVSLRKVRTPVGLLLVGGEASFELQPRVAGAVPVSATITDTVPANYRITAVEADAGWDCTVVGQLVSCAYTAEAGSDFRNPIVIKTEIVSAGLGVVNIAQITAPGENEGAEDNNTADDGGADIVVPVIDLVATKSTPPRGLVTVGNSYDFTLGARNEGNAPLAERVTITDLLPEGLEITKVDAPGWTCTQPPIIGPQQLVCFTDKYVGSPLGPQQSFSDVVVTAKVTQEGTFSNGLLVSFDDYLNRDPNPGDNTVYSGELTSANNDKWADLQLEKTVVGPASILAGEEITFRLEVINAGPGEARDIRLFDELRDIVAENGGVPGPISFAPTGGLICREAVSSGFARTLNCDLDTLARCESGVDCPYVDVTVRAGSVGGKKNEANVYSLVTPDPNTDNNLAEVPYTVTPRTDVLVTKVSTAVATGAAVGQELTYVITARVPDLGLSPAENVTVTDTLPDGVRFVSATPSGAGICSSELIAGEVVPNAAGDNTITCALGTLGSGSQQTVTVVVVPMMSVVNTDIDNVATVTTTTPEIDSANNTANVLVNITAPELDLEIQKRDGPDPVEINTDTTYTITVINSGPSDATNVVMVDTLPNAGLANPRMIEPLPAGWTCTIAAVLDVPGGTVTCEAERVRAGVPVELQMTMKAVERKRHTNKVEVSSTETLAGYDMDPANNTSYEDTTVRVVSDIEVTKTPHTPNNDGVVDLRQEFYWDLDVTALSGNGLDVAEGVVLTDTFPDGMVLTKAPVILHPGANRSCVGGKDDSAITCQLDEIAPGETVTVRVWVKIIAIANPGDTVVNRASATTQSFDKNPDNNTDVAGSVTMVQATSISGTIYRDFNNDGLLTSGRDTGIGNVSVVVSGRSLHDDVELVMPAVLTDANGNYTVIGLPPGTYTVTYTPASITEKHLDAGRAVVGTDSTGASAGTITSAQSISNIVVTTATGGIDYDFTLIPQARIGLAKAASATVYLADGSYEFTYSLLVKNLSLEPLDQIEISDDLTLAGHNFGTYTSDSEPEEGHYTISAHSSTIGVVETLFNGQAGRQTLVTLGTLAPGATGTASFKIRINQPVPRVSGLTHTNQAIVTGQGEYSGQTSLTNPQLTDPSNNGTNPDTNNNGIANEPGDNNATVVTPTFVPGVDIQKSAVLTQADVDAEVGDQTTYTFVVTNTGNTPLVDVTVDDPLPGLSALSGPTQPFRLEPGAEVTFTATYLLTQDDLDDDIVGNTATVTGQWGIDSGTPLTVTNTSSADVTPLAKPGLTISKTISGFTITDPSEVGQTITYAFLLTNTGNTKLRDVQVIDPLVSANPPAPVASLARNASETVYATYTITQADLDAGKVDNTAYATGEYGLATAPKTIDSTPDSATQPVFQNPSVQLTKEIDSATVPSEPRAGAELSWTVIATNDGNVTLETLTLDDPIDGAAIVPTKHDSVAPGQSVTFVVTAPITQEHINAATVDNEATLSFDTPSGTGTPVPADATTPLAQLPSITLTKAMTTIISDPMVPGAALRYRFTITNTGNLPVSRITLDDDLPGFVMDPASVLALAAATLEPQNDAGTVPLASRQISVEGRLPLTQAHIDAGNVLNEATASAYPTHGPINEPVKDTADVDTSLTRAPDIALVKTIISAPTGVAQAGDVVTYGFAIHNSGNVVLNSIALRELLIGSTVLNPTLWAGPMEPGDIKDDAFRATYVLTQDDINLGFVENSAEVEGVGIGPTGAPMTVKDLSGSAIDNDDATLLKLTGVSGLRIVKSAVETLSTPPKAGDTIKYSFVVTNTGNLTLRDVAINDPLLSATALTTIVELEPGAANAVTFGPITYTVGQAHIQAGLITNTANAAGTYKDPVTLVDTAISVPSNTITVVLDQKPGIAVIKEAVSHLNDPAVIGETIDYYFHVTNTGNITLEFVEIEDKLPGLPQSTFAVGTLAPAQSVTVGPIAYPIVQADIDRGEVVNQATASGEYDVGKGPVTISDLSGPTLTTDQNLIVPVLPVRPELQIVKRASFVGGTSYALVGDRIDFTFEITNLGNVPVENVRPEEVTFLFGGAAAETPITEFAPASVTLNPTESQIFTASYVLTQNDLNAGAGVADGVKNTAQALGVAAGVIAVTSPTDTATLTLNPQPPSDVVITKSTTRPVIHRGETVPFVIEVRNNSLANAGRISIVDRIPAGFVFLEGSATVDGVAVVPVVTGNEILFDSLPLPALQQIKIGLVLQALPGTAPGRYRNIAFGFDEVGTPTAEQAHADFEIVADAVFDCSDVIGTVFNDLNGNGYQDQDEPGIPGVRLSTARGVLVTTDAFGRYSIPCAALPDANIGSNFVLKIDAATLPTGFALTTDNPAMVRLTAGKMVEINFGAQIGRQIRISLDNGAFVSGSTAPSAELERGIEQLVTILTEQEARLQVVYEVAGDRQLAAARVSTLVNSIRERWRAAGAPYTLVIDTKLEEW